MDEDTVTDLGPRLRELRQQAELTLAEVATESGIGVSTLSRLESGERRPSVDHLVKLARLYAVTLDELVGGGERHDPRVHGKSVKRHGMTHTSLTNRPGGLQAYKLAIEAGKGAQVPDLKTHEGYEWVYVLNGRLRMVLGTNDMVLLPGEAAEFDTRTPHWFGRADEHAVEFLSIFGRQGERMHLRARPARRSTS
jgi:transcriptional regulator with XRE-family HTH domain